MAAARHADALSGPPFGIVLLIAACSISPRPRRSRLATHRLLQGFVIEGVAVAFVGLFLAQAMVALPSQTYAMPANAFALVLLGAIVEFFVRGLLRIRAAW